MNMIRLIVLWLSVTLLSACIGGVSTPTQFYSLNSQYLFNSNTTNNFDQDVSVGVESITLPDSINRPQIVTRENVHQIKIAEYHHWAGDLKDNMQKLLTSGLMKGLQSNRIWQYPWPRNVNPKYQIRIDILNFEGAFGEGVVLNGTWSIVNSNNSTTVEVNSFSFSKPISNSTYLALVESMGQTVELLAEQIVKVIRSKQK